MLSTCKVARSGAPVRAETARLLRDAILTQRFPPGTRLGERELMEMLEVSRTTVREALRQLETERLIELVPGKGPIVTALTDGDAMQIYEAREALECFAVRLFMRRATKADRDALDLVFRCLEDAYESGNTQKILSVKDGFYDAIYRGAKNSVIHEHASMLHARITPLRNASLSFPGRPAESMRELKNLMAAIERNDEDLAAEICSKHVRAAAIAAHRGRESDTSAVAAP